MGDKAVVGDKKFYSAKCDVLFKALFGDDRHTEILAEFLASIIRLDDGDSFDTLKIKDPQIKGYPDDKSCIFDVYVQTAKGKTIDVEVQLEKVAAMRERIVYYLSLMFGGQIVKGDDYTKLEKAISVIITDFPWIDNAQYSNRFTLYDEKSRCEFSDIISICTLELPKLPKSFATGRDGEQGAGVESGSDGAADGIDGGDNKPDRAAENLYNWMRLINAESADELELLKTDNNPMLREAVDVILELNADELIREEAEKREKQRRDAVARETYVREQGIEQGREQERAHAKAEKLQIAKNLTAINLSTTDIAKLTGLSIQEVEGLAQDTLHSRC